MNRALLGAVVAIALVVLTGGCEVLRSLSTDSGRGIESESPASALARKLLIVDTHIDAPYRVKRGGDNLAEATGRGQFDYPRAVEGGLDAAFMSIYVPAAVDAEGGATAFADDLIDLVEALVTANPDKFALAYTTQQVEANAARGLVSLPLGMENGAPIAGDLANLQHFYDRGIRYITLTHSRSNHISDSSYDENRQWNGLSDFGKELVRAMSRIGIMVDVSHISDEAFYQVMELSDVPVIASHSSARHFTPGFERNMSDEMITRLAEGGGVIQITAGSSFISGDTRRYLADSSAAIEAYLKEQGLEPGSPEARAYAERYRETRPYPYADANLLLDHIEHVVRLVGVDHVGIGSDFEGVGDTLPVGFKDVRDYRNLIEGLLARGYTEEEIAKIMGGNLMRVWRAVETYAESN